MATVAIADQLKVLVELQRLDGQLYLLRRELEDQPAQIQQLKAATEKSRQEFQALEAQYKALEVKRNSMETDLAQKEGQIKKLQTQLFQLKTNKEYSAMQKEIEGFKADQSVLEEEILKFMEESDRAKARVISEKEALRQKEADLNQQLRRVEEEKAQIEVQIQEREAGRALLTPRVEATILSQYERILKRKEGLALVPVVAEACGGCHMVLPPQMINEIQMATRLIPCESCARILYIEPTG